MERFEVTRAAWRAAVEAGAGELELPLAFTRTWTRSTGNYPATGMQLEEARAFARMRGMRLPTVREWMRIAAGTRGQRWPWGVVDQRAAANTLDLGLGRLAPVGTFENGNTFAGVCDMLGNAAEWVEPPLPVYAVWGAVVAAPARVRTVVPMIASGVSSGAAPRNPGPPRPAPPPGARAAPVPGPAGSTDAPSRPLPSGTWAMGGAYTDHQRPLHETTREDGVTFLARDLDPRHRSTSVGLRCVADAREYLWEHAADFSGEEDESAVRAVGSSWGVPAVGLLEELAQRAEAPVGLRWLLEGARGE